MAYAQSAAVPASDLLAVVTTYCQRENVAESMFGRRAVDDPRLVGDLRQGRQPGHRVTNRVLAFVRGTASSSDKSLRYLQHADDPHPLLADIARFLLATGMSDRVFGLHALGDPNFVEDVRCGRDVRRVTERRVRAYMASARS